MAIIQRGDSAKSKREHKAGLISMRNSPGDDSTPRSLCAIKNKTHKRQNTWNKLLKTAKVAKCL